MAVKHASQKGQELKAGSCTKEDGLKVYCLPQSFRADSAGNKARFLEPDQSHNPGHPPGFAVYAAISAGMTRPCWVGPAKCIGSVQCVSFLITMPIKFKDTLTEAAPQNQRM